MGQINMLTDPELEAALDALMVDGRTREEAVRDAVLRAHRAMMIVEQARADAERLASDPDDAAEMLAIQRFMGVAE
ncbi:hypothetical protein [Actinorhabdospora filicis]|nr:hypothetical protein [Actinorhabdospora filicis]